MQDLSRYLGQSILSPRWHWWQLYTTKRWFSVYSVRRRKTLVSWPQRSLEKNAGFLTTAFVEIERWFPVHSVRRGKTDNWITKLVGVLQQLVLTVSTQLSPSRRQLNTTPTSSFILPLERQLFGNLNVQDYSEPSYLPKELLGNCCIMLCVYLYFDCDLSCWV